MIEDEATGLSENTPGKFGGQKAGANASRKAAFAIWPRTGTMRRQVVDAIVASRGEGMTDDELQLHFAWDGNTERPRRIEAVEGGWITSSGRERYTSKGNDATVWVATPKAVQCSGHFAGGTQVGRSEQEMDKELADKTEPDGELGETGETEALHGRTTTKAERLELRERLLDCTACELHKVGSGPIPFSGPTPAEWAIIGEAPGKTEDKKGAPFIGQAGALMRMYVERVGLDITEAFICNTVSCFPDATPRPAHVIACKQNKVDQLALAGPQWVLVMGGVALGGFRPDLQITKAHGRPFNQQGVVYLPTFHPAGALRKHEWEEAMAREIGLFAQMVRACREQPQNWTGFVVDDCVTCDRTIEDVGQANEGIRYDDEGIAYCERCWPHSPYGRKEAA